MIIGESRAVSALWEAARARLPVPREDRRGQPVYAISETPEAGGSGLRAATPADLDRLVPACAAAHELELGIDPVARDSEAFRFRTEAQIDEGRSWLWLEDDVVLFKAEASAWTPAAVQIQQVWVDPEARGRGYATRGMRDLCRLLLGTTPVVTLFVRSENAPAIALYERIGMTKALEYRTVLL
jgi:predicted GNAT family acetyltransferase